MIRRPPRSTRTDTLFPDTTRFRSKLTVSDTFSRGTGTTATFQVNVPVQPTVNGREASAGRLHLRVLQPANATLNVRSWNSIDSGEYGKGWRIDVSGGSTGYVVELYEN